MTYFLSILLIIKDEEIMMARKTPNVMKCTIVRH